MVCSGNRLYYLETNKAENKKHIQPAEDYSVEIQGKQQYGASQTCPESVGMKDESGSFGM